MKRGKKIDHQSPKPQKTIIDFFKKQSQEPVPAILKITCPACFLVIPESKINWHLDQDCKSREKPKRKKDRNLAKRKKILSSVKNEIATKKKQRIMLSDDETDDFCGSDDSDDDVRIIESENLNNDTEPYITPSMVETVIFEIDKEEFKTPSKSQGSLSLKAEENNHSPHFSVNGKNVEHKEIKLESEISGSPQQRIALLQADWESPNLSPPKTVVGTSMSLSMNKSPTSSNNFEIAVEKNNINGDFTPSKLSLNKKRSKLVIGSGSSEMENFDSSSTYHGTPTKCSKEISKPCSDQLKILMETKKKREKSSPKLKSSCDTSKFTIDDNSDNDFENPIQYRTPEKFKKTKVKNVLGSGKKHNTTVSLSLNPSISSSPLSGPPDVFEALLAPLMSPSVVSPLSTPSHSKNNFDYTSDSSENRNEHIRKLFPTHSFEKNKVSVSEPKLSPSKVFLSQGIMSSTKRFPEIDKESIFDALLNAASESQESSSSSQRYSLSQNQSSQGGENKVWVRTPRKINQSIKSTGILQSSPQSITKSLFGRKRSLSLSPQKHSTSPNKQVSDSQNSPTVSEVFSESKYDKAVFRGHKGFYLENFVLIMSTVLSEPSDLQLFNEEDLSIVKSFHKLSLEAQKLYVRLFQRKLKWNRLSKLDYRDICDQEDMELYVKELSYANFLRLEGDLSDPDEVLQLLSADELKSLCKQMKMPSSGKKEDLIKSLLNFNKSQPSVWNAFCKSSSVNNVILKQAKEVLGQCYIVNKDVHRVFIRIIMLYGLPRYDDDDDKGNHTQLTTLLLVNLGKMSFPKYDVKRKHSIFQSRDELIRFEGCSQILTDLHDCLERQQWEESLQYCDLAKVTYQELISNKQLIEHDLSLPTFLRCYTSISVLVHILSCSIECYQRLKKYNEAVKQLRFLLDQTSYLQDYRGRWYDRLALNLEVYLKSPSKALEVIKEALSDPEVRVGHRLSLSIRAERMAASSRFKSLAPDILELPLMKPKEAPKVIIEGRSLPGGAGYKKVFIRQDSDRHMGEGEVIVCSVEELALNHYKSQGYIEGLHREGTTVNSLFGLLFWDIIYAPVPDAFRSPHQAAPLDLNDPHFYCSRKELIENRLLQLESYTEEEAGLELERIWNEHLGKTAMVAWDIFRSLEYLKGLVSSFKLPVLAAICRRLAVDHRFTRSGFPDLIVWNPALKKCCIVEVKGPNDRLSTKQILWLDYLIEHGAVAEVCHVEAIGAKKMKLASPRRISPKKRTPVKASEDKAKDKPGKRKQRKKKSKVLEEKDELNMKSVVPGFSDNEEESDFQVYPPKSKKGKIDKEEEDSRLQTKFSVRESVLNSKKKETINTNDEVNSKAEKSAEQMINLVGSSNRTIGEEENSEPQQKTAKPLNIEVDGVSVELETELKNIKSIDNIQKPSRKRKKNLDVEQKEELTVKPAKKAKMSQANEKSERVVKVRRNTRNIIKNQDSEKNKPPDNVRRSNRNK